MDRRQHALLQHRPQLLERSWLLAVRLVLLGQVACDGNQGCSGRSDTQDTGPDWVADPRCGVEGIPSDGAPVGVVSLGESEMTSLYMGGAFAAGDQNGDGCTDVAFATSGDEYDGNAGTTHIFSGPVTGDLDIENDWTAKLVGEPDDWAYHPFTGDVNGDGADDWMISGSNIQDGLGGVYIAFGPVTTSLELGSEADALLLAQNDMTGFEDHEAVDLDNDGYDDLLVGVSNYTAEHVVDGGVFLIPGPIAGTIHIRDATTLVHCGSMDASLGLSTSAGGDTNGDGLPDVAVGSAEVLGYRGAVWVLESPLSGEIDISDADATFAGESWSYAGDSISSGGDVDGDGYGDLLIGAWDHSDMGGRAYLVLGPFEGSHSLGDADAIVEADGFSAQVGRAVSLEQDMDADGRADVVIGAPGATGAPHKGAVFVFYETFEGTVDAFDEAEAVLYSENADYDYTGYRLAPAGDINGDGFDDLPVFSEFEYLVFGGVR